MRLFGLPISLGLCFWGELLGGIGAATVGGLFGAAGIAETNEANAAMAQRTMDFQERMYKNRHTYEVEDLRNAGLNPILSANSAASAPMGATAVMQNPMEQLGQGITNSGKTAAELMVASNTAELQKEKANTEKTQQKLNKSNAALADISAVLGGVNAKKAAAELPGKVAEGKIMSGKKGVFFKSVDMFTDWLSKLVRTGAK